MNLLLFFIVPDRDEACSPFLKYGDDSSFFKIVTFCNCFPLLNGATNVVEKKAFQFRISYKVLFIKNHSSVLHVFSLALLSLSYCFFYIYSVSTVVVLVKLLVIFLLLLQLSSYSL